MKNICDIMKKDSALVGLAGTYFVAAELSQRGYIATVTSRNTEGIDLLASNINGSKVVSIQVKTSGARIRERFSRSWMMQQKHENVYSDSFFYVFVDLKPNEKPDFYVVPSKVVADYLKHEHEVWLKTPGRGGKKHNDTTMRLFEINDEKDIPKYLNRWDLFGL